MAVFLPRALEKARVRFLREETTQDVINSERYNCRFRCADCGGLDSCNGYAALDEFPQTVYSDKNTFQSDPFFNEVSREVQLIDRLDPVSAKAAPRVTFTSVTAVLRNSFFHF